MNSEEIKKMVKENDRLVRRLSSAPKANMLVIIDDIRLEAQEKAIASHTSTLKKEIAGMKKELSDMDGYPASAPMQAMAAFNSAIDSVIKVLEKKT